MIIKNCSVEGIERIEGNRKSDGRPFAFWKLHLTTEFPTYDGKPSGEGNKTLTVNVNDEEFHRDHLALCSLVDVYTRGSYTDYIGKSV